MKPPKFLQIGARRYTVRVDRAELNALAVELRTGLYGVTDNEKMRITLAPSNSAVRQVETFMHEWLHTLCDLTGLNKDVGDELEEKFVTALAPALVDAMRRNPDAVAYVMSGS